MRAFVAGIGIFLGLALAARAETFTMNFNNADLRTVIQYVAKATGRNFLVDNRVRGTVTVIGATPMSADELWDVFQSVLEVNGYAAVVQGDVVKIVPRAEGKQKPVPVVTRARGGDALATSVIRLKYADAQQLVAILRPLVAPNSHVVAYPRGNMILITDALANIRRIGRIVRLLDRKEATGVRLVPLEHASAEKLAALIARLYPAKTALALKAIAHEPGNMLVLVGPPQLLNEAEALVRRLDREPKTDLGRLHIRYLRFAKAEEMAKVLTGLLGAKGPKGKGVVAGEVRIVAEPSTNALLVTADPNDWRAIARIVDRLDIERRQVLIESLIVEVSANALEQFGVEWRALNDFNRLRRQPFGGTNFPSQSGVSLQGVAANPFNTGAGLVVGLVKGTVTFGGQTFLNLGALARALETRAHANVLSTPTLLTLDNESAEIIVGQNVPFITGRATTQGGVANPFQTIERRDIGLKLKVKPRIAAGDALTLEIYQEISSIDRQATAQGADLITNKRSIQTVVLAHDGQTIVLGGLMREDGSQSVQRVPCLGAIPILGEFFRFTENRRRKTNLMVFLKPHIVRSPADLAALVNEKYVDIRELYEKPADEGTILFPQPRRKLPGGFRPAPPAPPAPEKGKK